MKPKLNPTHMQAAATSVAGLMAQLSNPKRLLLLCHLSQAEQSVGSLVSLTGWRQAAVSQQLMLLRSHSLVTTRRSGQTVYYKLARPDVQRLLEFLYQTYCSEK